MNEDLEIIITVFMLFALIVALVWLVFPFIVMSRLRKQEWYMRRMLEEAQLTNANLFGLRYPNYVEAQAEETDGS